MKMCPRYRPPHWLSIECTTFPAVKTYGAASQCDATELLRTLSEEREKERVMIAVRWWIVTWPGGGPWGPWTPPREYQHAWQCAKNCLSFFLLKVILDMSITAIIMAEREYIEYHTKQPK